MDAEGVTLVALIVFAWGLFSVRTGTNIVYIPYKGAAAAFTDLLAGQIQMNFDATGSLLPHIREGKLRALAVSSPQRNPALPEVPTMTESGIDMDVALWLGLFAPAGTPPEIVAKLEAECRRIAQLPDFKAKLRTMATDSLGTSSAEFAKKIATEIDMWKGVAKQANAKFE